MSEIGSTSRVMYVLIECYAFNQYNEFQRPILAVFESMRGSERVNEQSEKVENSKKVPKINQKSCLDWEKNP